MSFKDTLKRSLGYEESEIGSDKSSNTHDEDLISNISNNISNLLKDISKPSNNSNSRKQHNPTPRPAEGPTYHPRPTPVDESDYVIVPESSFYEIVLIRPKTIDDINYVVDQVVDEKNPVIVDLSFLEKESDANFRLAGEKIKYMRGRHNAQAVLLEHTEEKHLILLSPRKVNVINKG